MLHWCSTIKRMTRRVLICPWRKSKHNTCSTVYGFTTIVLDNSYLNWSALWAAMSTPCRSLIGSQVIERQVGTSNQSCFGLFIQVHLQQSTKGFSTWLIQSQGEINWEMDRPLSPFWLSYHSFPPLNPSGVCTWGWQNLYPSPSDAKANLLCHLMALIGLWKPFHKLRRGSGS